MKSRSKLWIRSDGQCRFFWIPRLLAFIDQYQLYGSIVKSILSVLGFPQLFELLRHCSAVEFLECW